MKTQELRLISGDVLEDAAECLRVLGHPVRLRIVDILTQGEFRVGRIAKMCGVRPSQVSEHLRLLQGRGLLESERRSRSVYYSIVDPRLPRLIECVRMSCAEGAFETLITPSRG